MLNSIFTTPCPLDKPNYRFVGDKCYYFETNGLDYGSARVNCNSKFKWGGKLFEPTSLKNNENVYAEAKTTFGNLKRLSNSNWLERESRIWIGINDFLQEGMFVYTESGLSISFNLPWMTNQPDNH